MVQQTKIMTKEGENSDENYDELNIVIPKKCFKCDQKYWGQNYNKYFVTRVSTITPIVDALRANFV